MPSDQSAMLLSPGYERYVNQDNQRFGKRFFCLYNVSLNCRSESVVIRSTHTTTWPRGPNPECKNYISFLPDRDSKTDSSLQFCGGNNFRVVLESNSFLAVMWTTSDANDGVFGFDASCRALPDGVTQAAQEGSGQEEPFAAVTEKMTSHV